MEIVTFIIGCLLGVGVSIIYIKKTLIGKLKILWDRQEHQPYMFMELANPDITKITSKKYVMLRVDKNIEYSQK